MPLPLLPLIGLGANLLGQGINAASTARANKQQRDFELQMFNMSRSNALADREFENAYNSPAAQMERFRAAGLNPNLIYGNGTQASQSVHTAQTPTGHIQPKAQNFQIGEIINQFMSSFIGLQSLQAQTDNLKAQTELTKQKTVSETLAQPGITLAQEGQKLDQAGKQIANDFASVTFDDRALGTSLRNEKIKIDTAFTQHQDMRNAAMSSQNIRESVERMLKLRAERENLLPAQLAILKQQLENMATDGRIKEVQANLWEMGINPHNPAWMTASATLAQKVWDVLKVSPMSKLSSGAVDALTPKK